MAVTCPERLMVLVCLDCERLECLGLMAITCPEGLMVLVCPELG